MAPPAFDAPAAQRLGPFLRGLPKDVSTVAIFESKTGPEIPIAVLDVPSKESDGTRDDFDHRFCTLWEDAVAAAARECAWTFNAYNGAKKVSTYALRTAAPRRELDEAAAIAQFPAPVPYARPEELPLVKELLNALKESQGVLTTSHGTMHTSYQATIKHQADLVAQLATRVRELEDENAKLRREKSKAELDRDENADTAHMAMNRLKETSEDRKAITTIVEGLLSEGIAKVGLPMFRKMLDDWKPGAGALVPDLPTSTPTTNGTPVVIEGKPS